VPYELKGVPYERTWCKTAVPALNQARRSEVKIRQAVVASCVWAAVVALPPRANAQETAFVQALSELTASLEGTYGDEGARIRAALDRMSVALAAWDRDIEAAESELRRTQANDPPSTVAERHVSLGRTYADRGRLADALAEFDAAGRLAPTRADVQVLRGLVLQEQGTPAEAIEAFRRARALDPGNPVTAYYLFHEAAISGNASAAQEASEALAAAYPKLLQAKPLDSARGKPQRGPLPFTRLAPLPGVAAGPPILPPAAYSQAFRDLARGQFERVITEFRTAAAGDPLIADPAAGSALMVRAFGALRQGRVAEARALLEESGPPRDSSEAHRVLGLAYWAQSDYNRSIASLTTAISLSPRDERARLALARALNAAGRDADAERMLEETVRLLPDSVLAHWWLTLAYEQLHRPAEARQEVEQVAAAAAFGKSQLYAAIGRFAVGDADGPAGIDAFARAVTANPNDPAMHRLLATTLMQQDRADEAVAEFMAALLIDPLDAAAHAGIGRSRVQTGRDADAVDALRRAIELAPTDGETRYALASALERLGRSKEAAEHFARVEQAQRQALADQRRELSAAALKQEAALRTAEGKFDAAIALYEKALAIEPDPVAYSRLADLYAKVGRPLDAARARALSEKATR
jgi:tetratricopeptide (TPR) repeat protein